MLIVLFTHVPFLCIILFDLYCHLACVFGSMYISNACTCLVCGTLTFVFRIFRGCGCGMFTFFSLAKRIGHAVHLDLLVSLHSLFLLLPGPNKCNSTKYSRLWISQFVSNNQNSHLKHVLVVWSIIFGVTQLYESFGRKPGWRFTARCKSMGIILHLTKHAYHGVCKRSGLCIDWATSLGTVNVCMVGPVVRLTC